MSNLAIFGGEPVRSNPFPAWPKPSSELKESLIHTLTEENWGVGSDVIKQFDEAFAEFQDSKYCISTSSGSTALWVALKAAGVKAGDEVIVPSYTFIATASAVLMANAIPVFVDIDENSLNLDPGLIEDAVTEKTRTIMPVHLAGNPANMDKIITIGEKHGIPIIEDAAQAHGAEWGGKKVGALGHGGIFSFQTSKNMSAGEGGAIVSNDEAFIETCFSYHNCGRVKGGQFYEHHHLGGNFRINAFAAAMLKVQLNTLQKDMAIRDKNRERLDKALSQIEGIDRIKSYEKTTRSANHLYIVRYDENEFNHIPREVFFKAMQSEGIYTYSGYTPLYREKLFITDSDEYPWLKDIDYSTMKMPVAERIADREAVWLKQNHLLGTDEDIRDIIDAFEKVTTAMKREPELFLDKDFHEKN